MDSCFKELEDVEVNKVDIQPQSIQCSVIQQSPRKGEDGTLTSEDKTVNDGTITSKDSSVDLKPQSILCAGIQKLPRIAEDRAKTSLDETVNDGTEISKDIIGTFSVETKTSKDDSVIFKVGAETFVDDSITINCGARTSKDHSGISNVGAGTSKDSGIIKYLSTSKYNPGISKYELNKTGPSKEINPKSDDKDDFLYRANNVLDKMASVATLFRSELQNTKAFIREHLEILEREESQIDEITNSIKELQDELTRLYKSETVATEVLLYQIRETQKQFVELSRRVINEEEMQTVRKSKNEEPETMEEE